MQPHSAYYARFLFATCGDMDRTQKCSNAPSTPTPTTHPHSALRLFLHTVRGDMDQAQNMYQRAITADPINANNLGNYAQILFVRSDDMKAINLADKAISLAGNDEKPLLNRMPFLPVCPFS